MSEMKKNVHIGDRFGRLTVVSEPMGLGRHRVVNCRCDCGADVLNVRVSHLADKSTVSCGCYSREQLSARSKKHGEWTTKLWGHWSAMRRRCNTGSTGNYDLYGGRGISVCEEWKDYLAFRAWALANGYNDSLSLDRVDVDGDYCPENCRWVTAKEQARNRRNTVYVEFKGAHVPLATLSEQYNIDPDLVYARVVRYGWDVERALTTPKKGGVK